MTDSKDGRRSETVELRQVAPFHMVDVPSFSGDDVTYTSSKWAQDLEDNAEIFEWSPPQRLIIARRSLTGTAQLWLKTEKVHKTYEELKAAVIKEFPDGANSKEMHEMMSARKKRKDETYYQYMLVMKEMGKRAKFPDYVSIQYIVDGIIDLEVNKAILYGAVTYPALKEKLAIYETIKKKSVKQTVDHPAKPIRVIPADENLICYNCGGKNHRASTCRKGVKCFRCNQFGHISTQCTNHSVAKAGSSSGPMRAAKEIPSAHTSVKQRSAMFGAMSAANQDVAGGHVEDDVRLTDITDVMHVNKWSDRRNVHNKTLKEVKLCDKTIKALIDTGSDVNLIAEDLWCKLSVPCEDDNTVLSGLGRTTIKSCGKTYLDLTINEKCYYNVIFHVVRNGVIPYQLMIGQEFLRKVVMVLREGAVSFLAPDDEWLSRVNCCVTEVDVAGSISDSDVKTKVMRLVDEYKPLQTKEAPIETKIVLKDDVPVTQLPRGSHLEQKIVEEHLEEGIQKGIVQVSCSKYSSPLAVIKKKDGSIPICVDKWRQLMDRPERVGPVYWYPKSKIVKQRLKLIGLTSVFRKGIKGYAFSDRPFIKLMRKDVPFIFEDEQRCAFHILKLSSDPVLKIYNACLNYLYRQPVIMLNKYDLEIEHKSGSRMKDVDAHSRNPLIAGLSLQGEIRRGQWADDKLNTIHQLILKDSQYEDFCIDNGILYTGTKKQLVVPRIMEKEIIKKVHQNGHFPIRKMKEVIGRNYYNRNMYKRIEEIVLSCIQCLLAMKKEDKRESYLHSIDKEDTPLHTFHLDYIGTFNKTKKQYSHIRTKIDGFTLSYGQVKRSNCTLIPMLTERCIEDESMSFKHVIRVQRTMNSTYLRSRDTTLFQLFAGTKIRCKEELKVHRLLQLEVINSLDENREDVKLKAT